MQRQLPRHDEASQDILSHLSGQQLIDSGGSDSTEHRALLTSGLEGALHVMSREGGLDSGGDKEEVGGAQ